MRARFDSPLPYDAMLYIEGLEADARLMADTLQAARENTMQYPEIVTMRYKQNWLDVKSAIERHRTLSHRELTRVDL